MDMRKNKTKGEKTMKKLVALILALTMIVGLCACAKTGGDTTKPADTKSTTDTKATG